MSLVRIDALTTDRTWYRPGARAHVTAVVTGAPDASEACLTLLDLEREEPLAVAQLEPGPAASVEFAVRLPRVARHGYGLRLEVRDGRHVVASATAAVEVLEDAWQSPRHASLTDFLDPADAARATRALARWHVNVVQHYDWMWRHYRYVPPGDGSTFEDALGRAVSHDAVRAAIAEGHRAGVTSLAYGAVYGAEREHVDEHPDDMVYDDGGQPLSLGGTFFINDIRPGTRWRERLLGEYTTAIEQLGFDGVHMDTYGPPHTAVAGDGERMDFAALYPGLVDEAATLLDGLVPGTRVLFNCVEGYPLESVAPSATAALYLELWPPDDSFADVVRWIDRARSQAAGRAVIIAAYAAALNGGVAPPERPAALEASILLGSIIQAAGAYHHTLAEGDRLLVEGYYPAAVALESAEIEEMRALWRFGARYVHLLSDPRAVLEDPDPVVLSDAAGSVVEWATTPAPGVVWMRQVRTADGTRVLHIVDLRHQADGRWDAPKAVTGPAVGLRLEWDRAGDAPVAISPWSASGDVFRLASSPDGYALPDFRRWVAVVAA